jgi:hypothetical protein
MRGTAGDIRGAETGRAPPIAAVDTAHAAWESYSFATDPALPLAAVDTAHAAWESYSFATDPALPIAAVDTAHAAWESYRLVFVQCHSSTFRQLTFKSPARPTLKRSQS